MKRDTVTQIQFNHFALLLKPQSQGFVLLFRFVMIRSCHCVTSDSYIGRLESTEIVLQEESHV